MYAKVYSQIFDSSLADDYQTRHIFMDLLVLADRHGVVDMTLDAISRRTNVPIALVKTAIRKLCQPDPASRTDKHDGRRLVLLDEHRSWGWRVVNYETYRNMKNEDARREYMRNYQRNRRAGCKHPSTPVNTSKPPLAHADTDTEVDTKGEKKPPSSLEPNPEAVKFVDALRKKADVKKWLVGHVNPAFELGLTAERALAFTDKWPELIGEPEKLARGLITAMRERSI